MTNDINEVMDTLDAAVFSGDTFLNKENLENFKHFLERWNSQVKVLESTGENIFATDSFVAAVTGNLPILKVDNIESTYWNIEENEEDENDYILVFGFENYDINFKESDISNIEDLGNNSWKVTFSEDGKEKISIFKFYS